MKKDAEIWTEKERGAIRRFRLLAKTWPQSLMLYSWSGMLLVLHTTDYANQDHVSFDDMASITIFGIPNDGGDPD